MCSWLCQIVSDTWIHPIGSLTLFFSPLSDLLSIWGVYWSAAEAIGLSVLLLLPCFCYESRLETVAIVSNNNCPQTWSTVLQLIGGRVVVYSGSSVTWFLECVFDGCCGLWYNSLRRRCLLCSYWVGILCLLGAFTVYCHIIIMCLFEAVNQPHSVS